MQHIANATMVDANTTGALVTYKNFIKILAWQRPMAEKKATMYNESPPSFFILICILIKILDLLTFLIAQLILLTKFIYSSYNMNQFKISTILIEMLIKPSSFRKGTIISTEVLSYIIKLG